MPEPQTLMTGIAFGESPRWHDNRLWLSDWVAQEVLAVDLGGRSEVIVRTPSSPFSIDWLPDGRLLIVSGPEGVLLCREEPDGSLVTHADLSGLSDHPWNEIVVDGRGNAYVNNIGFDFPAGEFAPGIVALLTPDGSVRQVADGVAFPNGMAVTPDNSTLILAESYGNKLTAFDIAEDGGLSNRRVWADLDDGVPDGICIDAEGAVWYGDVPNRRCVRVREGGEVLQKIELDIGLRLHARRRGRENLVHGDAGVGWYREHCRGGANGPGANRGGARAGRRLAVGERDPGIGIQMIDDCRWLAGAGAPNNACEEKAWS